MWSRRTRNRATRFDRLRQKKDNELIIVESRAGGARLLLLLGCGNFWLGKDVRLWCRNAGEMWIDLMVGVCYSGKRRRTCPVGAIITYYM